MRSPKRLIRVKANMDLAAPISILAALAAAAGPVAGPGALAPGDGPSLAAIEAEQSRLYSQIAPSVVLILSDGASGSGFVVTRDGLVLTNAHVVGESAQVTVQLLDGRRGRGQVVARATGALDLALVRMPFEGVRPIPAGDPAELRAGMYAATVGHGGGAAWTFSTGLIANPRPLGDGAPMLLAQMALRPGSSGGPLFDRLGRAVGVITAGTRDASGVTFAIRAEAAAAAFPELAGWETAPVPLATSAPAPQDEGAVASTASLDEGRIVAVSRLSRSSGAEPGGGPAATPPSAPMKTVWEAPRAPRRASGRVPVRATPSPAPACGPELACRVADQPSSPTVPAARGWHLVIAATAGGAAAATAAGAIARGRRR